MSDRIVVMDHGRIEQVGTPPEIYEEPVNLKVATFVGEVNLLDARIRVSAPNSPKDTLSAEVEGEDRVFFLKTNRGYRPGQAVKILLRPEDLTVQRDRPADPSGQWLEGVVDDTIYKGTTYDIAVTLSGGKQLLVTEFFDEDAEEMTVAAGERVFVSWIKGWEVVLPDEDPGTV